MDATLLLIILALVILLVVIGGIIFLIAGSRKDNAPIRELMASRQTAQGFRGSMRAPGDEQELKDIEEIKELTGSAQARSSQEDLTTKLFKAGYYTPSDRDRFTRFRIVSFVLSFVLIPLVSYVAFGKLELLALGIVLGGIIGFAFPMTWLERQIRARNEEILYYLPLAIEQVSIGVSSALDVGPCISHIIQLANERQSHNPITEMFIHVEKLIRSGLNLEDALVEVGTVSGLPEVKHAFMFLAQCAKHGGEVTRQLQELADAVMVQRQVSVEEKIAALPVKATGPLAMVFAGFFALLFAGLVVRLGAAFGG